MCSLLRSPPSRLREQSSRPCLPWILTLASWWWGGGLLTKPTKPGVLCAGLQSRPHFPLAGGLGPPPKGFWLPQGVHNNAGLSPSPRRSQAYFLVYDSRKSVTVHGTINGEATMLCFGDSSKYRLHTLAKVAPSRRSWGGDVCGA